MVFASKMSIKPNNKYLGFITTAILLFYPIRPVHLFKVGEKLVALAYLSIFPAFKKQYNESEHMKNQSRDQNQEIARKETYLNVEGTQAY